MTSLELAVTPGLVVRFEEPPAALASEIERLLGRGEGRRRVDETVVALAATPPPETEEPGELLLAEEGLEVRARGDLVTFERGGIVGWRDGASGRGGLWAPRATSEEARTFVSLALAPLLIELAEPLGWLGLHAAAVAVGGRGILLPGPSGAGKSTVFRHSHRAGLDVLSDDLVWLETGAAGFRLHPFPRWLGEEEAAEVPPPTAWSASVAAIVAVTIADRASSRLVPMSPSETVDVLVAESGFLGPRRAAGERFAALVRLAGTAPGYRLEAGRRRVDAPALLRGLASELDDGRVG